jgi:hypothetical protein
VPAPVPAGIALAALAAWLVRPLVLDRLPDHPRPAWQVHGFEIPYFVHWSAVHVAVAGWLLAWVAWLSAPLHGGNVSLGDWSVASYGVGIAIALWGTYVRRFWTRLRTVNVRVSRLPPQLDGYRIAHLSDLHIGSFTSPRQARRWVRRTNQLRCDLVAITGDVVSSGSEFHPQIAKALGLLDARDGVVFIPGNHDYFGKGQLFQHLEAEGIRVLRNQQFAVTRQGGARLIIAGVEDPQTGLEDVAFAVHGRGPGEPVVLLAHDPGLFPQAVRAKVDVVLSGHTHGGQIAVPFAARWLSVTSLFARYRLGTYRQNDSTLVVSAGLGTTGPPLRIGAAPEILIVRLRSASGDST